MKIDGNEIKVGNILEIKNKLWRVLKTQHTQPGKGGAYLQVELRDLRNGTKLNERFRSSETVERAQLEQKEYQFLYSENNTFTFMNNDSFEQITLDVSVISEEQIPFLQESMIVTIESYEDDPIGVQLPDHIILEVVEADAVVKGQTASSSYKPALLENGMRTLVPPHIDSGTRIVVSTVDCSYIERAKD